MRVMLYKVKAQLKSFNTLWKIQLNSIQIYLYGTNLEQLLPHSLYFIK